MVASPGSNSASSSARSSSASARSYRSKAGISPSGSAPSASILIPSALEVRDPDAGMHALHEVDHLGDVEVGRRTEVGESVRAVHAVPRMQQLDRGAHAVPHRLVEVLVE